MYSYYSIYYVYIYPHTALYVSSYYYLCLISSSTKHSSTKHSSQQMQDLVNAFLYTRYIYIHLHTTLYLCPHTAIYDFFFQKQLSRDILAADAGPRERLPDSCAAQLCAATSIRQRQRRCSRRRRCASVRVCDLKLLVYDP